MPRRTDAPCALFACAQARASLEPNLKDRMHRRRICWLWALLIALSGGCHAESPATEVLVVIDSDLRVGTELTSLHVEVRGAQGESITRDFALVEKPGRAGAYTMPLSWSLTPGAEGAMSAFRLLVTGRGPGAEQAGAAVLVQRQVSAAFTPGARMRLDIALDRACLQVACGGASDAAKQTCSDGVCTAVPTLKLRPASEGPLGGFVASAAPDASVRAQPDAAGTSTACDPAGSCQAPPGAGTDTTVDVDLGADAGLDCSGQGHGGSKGCECDPLTDIQVDCSLRADGTPIPWPAGTPVGACQYGKRSCRDGVWGRCSGAIEPAPEDSCLPDDDANCNGQRNEGCECSTGATRPCGTDVGACSVGTQTCSGGMWSQQCLGAVMPHGKDTCEPGSDNDCNGIANEGCTCVNGASSTCGAALNAKGLCAARAVMCVGGAWQAGACTTTASEQCIDNGQDENCDGKVNEPSVCACLNGQTTSCGAAHPELRGACRNGTSKCVNGKWGDCDTLPASRDTCEVLAGDENCNGIPWQGCTCVDLQVQSCSVGACTGGTQVCSISGNWGTCTGTTCPDADAGT